MQFNIQKQVHKEKSNEQLLFYSVDHKIKYNLEKFYIPFNIYEERPKKEEDTILPEI